MHKKPYQRVVIFYGRGTMIKKLLLKIIGYFATNERIAIKLIRLHRFALHHKLQ